MANPNLTRKHQKIFSEFAPNNGQFGSLEASGGVTGVITNDITTLQALAAYQEGFNDAVISGDALPSLEEVNGLHKINTEQLQYLLNKGVPEWSADAEYYIGDIQREVGGSKIYQSITDNNINNALTDTLNWKIWDVTVNKFNTTPNTATISGGAITYTGAYMVIDTEGGAATDNLDTINGGSNGDIVRIRITDNTRDITIRDELISGGNIRNTKSRDQNRTLTLIDDTIEYQYRFGIWYETNRSLDNDFKNSRSSNGYTYLPNGLIIQWGVKTGVGTSLTTVTLPIAHPNATLQVLATSRTDNRILNVTGFANASFQAQVNTSTAIIGWMTIGY